MFDLLLRGNNLALPKTSIMIALNDVNNELHVRLYILEVFKDYVRDDDFDELLDKALDFVMEGVSMPKAPVKDTTMSDISRSIIALACESQKDFLFLCDLNVLHNTYGLLESAT
jgi:hypothetical protein